MPWEIGQPVYRIGTTPVEPHSWTVDVDDLTFMVETTVFGAAERSYMEVKDDEAGVTVVSADPEAWSYVAEQVTPTDAPDANNPAPEERPIDDETIGSGQPKPTEAEVAP